MNSLLYADDLVLWSPGSDIPKLESTLNSGLVTLANWSLENDFKHNSLVTELRHAALATIPERYLDQNWLHVFTDGSATSSFGRSGAGAFSNSFNLNMILLVPGETTLMAQLRPYLATIYFNQKLSLSAKNLIISFLYTRREVVLQWIPFHCGIYGNEQADKWAKDFRSCIHVAFPMPLRNAKRLRRNKFRQKGTSTLTDLAVSKSWSRLLDGLRRAQFSALPRVVVAFPARPRQALLEKDLVTWQAMVGRHILEDIVGRVAQHVDEHYPVDKWHLGDLIAWVAQSALKYRPRICELSKCLEGPLKMIVCPKKLLPTLSHLVKLLYAARQ
ncbi:uncharacterized protein LOC103524116 [Trichonephila clavipes]|nr:uncharacterized protein LOC103524116 [Trichonephila clavipes]